jgi:HisJ family histidinol phosphate phosphatase
MPHSHHSHSGQFCRHALGSLEEVVSEAIKQRFEVYGLTEHVPRYRLEDLYPEEVVFPSSNKALHLNPSVRKNYPLMTYQSSS